MSRKECVIIRESLFQSVLSDIFTFGILLVTAYINVKVLSSGFLTVVLWTMALIILMLKLIGVSLSGRIVRVYTKEKAITEIEELFNEEK